MIDFGSLNLNLMSNRLEYRFTEFYTCHLIYDQNIQTVEVNVSQVYLLAPSASDHAHKVIADRFCKDTFKS